MPIRYPYARSNLQPSASISADFLRHSLPLSAIMRRVCKAQGEQGMEQGETKRLFGTDGIRGRAGAHPVDEQTIVLIGRALVDNLTRELGRAPHLVIGRDKIGRASCRERV